jgi:hypothetical protein
MNQAIEDAIVASCNSNEDAKPPVIGEKFAASYDSLAGAVIDSREILALGLFPIIMHYVLGDRLSFMAYGCEHPARRKRVSMDIQKMVDGWVPQIKKLALAHDIDEKDAASSAMDELLLPIIGAPVKEIREFYRALTANLKEDKTVPWAIWKLFDFWGTNVLENINKEEMIGLKTELARRIAESSMEQIPREDWINSMIGALQWRSPEKLAEIDTALAAGEKPRVKGKESCLFLEVGGKEVML